MNDYLLSVILGIVEGLTEFLPVSSTAHLRIAEALLHIDLASGYWKMYTIVIQLGAILTLPIYFRHRIAKFLSTFPKGERGDRTVLTHPLSLVTIAFVVTAIPAFLMTKMIGKHLESLYIMGCALLIGGIVMWFIDARNSKAEAAGEGSQDRTDSHVAHGRYEPGTGSVDRSVPDPVGGVSGDFAVHVDDRSRTVGGDVARVGIGVFVFPVDPDDGGGDGVRLAEVAGGEECESDWSGEHRCAWLDRAGDRICGVVYRGVWHGRMVHGLCQKARIRPVCGLSNCAGDTGALFRRKNWLAKFTVPLCSLCPLW